MMLVELLACAAGLIAGFVAARLSIAGAQWLGDAGFWRRLADFGRLLLSPDDEKPLLDEYLRLWPALFGFVAKRMAVGIVALVPVVLAFAALTPLERRIKPEAVYIEVDPPQPLVVELPGGMQRLDQGRATIPAPAGLEGPAVISAPGGRLCKATPIRKQAYASRRFAQHLLDALGFARFEPDEPCQDTTDWLLVRPSWGDNNAFWPYLSDWEFDFFAAAGVASVVGLLVARKP